MKQLLVSAASVLALAIATGGGIVALGFAPVAADRGPSAAEATVLRFALRRAVEREAAGVPANDPPSDEQIADGAEIYRESCARCHGEPGKPPSVLGSSFHPPATALPGHATGWSDRELVWIIEHGIRNTGMPAWRALLSEDDAWAVAAYVRGLEKTP